VKDCKDRVTGKYGRALWIVGGFLFAGVVYPRGYVVFFADSNRAFRFEEFEHRFEVRGE
jgi:hypothetical protein